MCYYLYYQSTKVVYCILVILINDRAGMGILNILAISGHMAKLEILSPLPVLTILTYNLKIYSLMYIIIKNAIHNFVVFYAKMYKLQNKKNLHYNSILHLHITL